MITAIIRSETGARALVRTLAPLVRGVVEGVLGAVLIGARPTDAESRLIGEESGARVLETGNWRDALALAAAQAPGGLLLAIDSGVVLGEAFWPEVQEALASGLDGPFVTRPADERPADRLMRRLSGRITPMQAVIARTHLLAGDPWSGGLRARPVILRAASFRPEAPGR